MEGLRPRRPLLGFGSRVSLGAPRRASSQSPRDFMTSEAIDGIAFPPGLGLRCFAVAGVVVRGRMSAASIAHPFDERRSAALPRTFDGLSNDVVHRQGVGAVDAHAIETIRLRFDRDRLGAGLQLERYGDRILVVAERGRIPEARRVLEISCNVRSDRVSVGSRFRQASQAAWGDTQRSQASQEAAKKRASKRRSGSKCGSGCRRVRGRMSAPRL